ncbi:MAG TPA: hypothetical protein VIL99_00090 [Ignavibacteria bacterium]|jgi:hypothetical protein
MNWLYHAGRIAGIVLSVIGIAFVALYFFMPGKMDVSIMTGAILFVTGIIVFAVNTYFYKMFKDFPKPKGFNESFRSGADQMSSAANFLKEQNKINKLSSTGKPVRVKIISVRDTGKLVNYDPVLEFNLEVLHERRYDNYNITNHQQVVSKIIAPRLIPGNEYPAKVDPEDKNSIHISWL